VEHVPYDHIIKTTSLEAREIHVADKDVIAVPGQEKIEYGADLTLFLFGCKEYVIIVFPHIFREFILLKGQYDVLIIV
jgi:hypothetical protein